MSLDASPQKQALPCGGFISTAFTFNTVAVQNAANFTYVAKSTADGLYSLSNATAPKKYTFKSDRERMLYIIGRQGSVAGCSGY